MGDWHDGEGDEASQRGAAGGGQQDSGARQNKLQPVQPHQRTFFLNEEKIRKGNAQSHHQAEVVRVQTGASVTLVSGLVVYKISVNRVAPGHESSQDIGLHQSFLLQSLRSEFPNQPHQRKKLHVGDRLRQRSLRIKTPQVRGGRRSDKQQKHEVASCRTSDAASFQNGHEAEYQGYYTDQAGASSKAGNGDGVFPRNRKNQQPEAGKRHLAKG